METIREITECCICTDVFTDPKILPCIHTFCLKCLQNAQEKIERKAGDTMPCPMCRREFTIPSGGMGHLQKNFFMERLVGIRDLLKTPEKDKVCEKCLEEEEEEEGRGEGTIEVPSAVLYCIQCHKNICNRCSRDHKRYAELKMHRLVPLGSQLKDEFIRQFVNSYCDQHVEMKCQMYCTDCKKEICMMCFAENHQMHKCCDIEKVAKQFRDQITDAVGRLNDCSKETDAITVRLIKEKRDFHQEIQDTEESIVTRMKELKDRIDAHGRILLDELATIKQRGLKSIDSEKEESERHKVMIESFKAYCSELNGKGSAAEICRAVNDLKSRADELQEMHKVQVQKQVLSKVVSLQCSKLNDSTEFKNIVGEIIETDAFCEVINVEEPSSQLLDKAKELLLPKYFFNYLDFPACTGCIGCDSDSFDFSKIGQNRAEVKANCRSLLYISLAPWILC